MSYYSLVYLPEEVKDLEGFTFSKEQIKGNKLWKMEGTPHYVHTYDNPTYSISGKTMRKDVVPFKFLRLNDQQFRKVTEHFLKKGVLSLLRFTSEFEDGFEPEGYNEITKLRYKVLNGKVEESDIVSSLKILNYLLEEEYLNLDYIQIVVNRGERPIEVRFYSTSTITFSNVFNSIQEEDILNLYIEIMEVLTGEKSRASIETLKQHDELIHPLTNEYKVVEKLLRYSGQQVCEELGIDEKEWSLIEEDLKRNAKIKEGKIVYKHQYDRIISDLKSNKN